MLHDIDSRKAQPMIRNDGKLFGEGEKKAGSKLLRNPKKNPKGTADPAAFTRTKVLPRGRG